MSFIMAYLLHVSFEAPIIGLMRILLEYLGLGQTSKQVPTTEDNINMTRISIDNNNNLNNTNTNNQNNHD